MAKESHEGLETPGVERYNQKTRMTTSFRKAKLNTCHFFPLTFLSFPSSVPKSNLSDAAYLFAKVTFCGLSSRLSDCCHCACWIRVRVCQNSRLCINLPRPPMSSAKVQKEIMQMTICCVLFVFFFLTLQVRTQLHLCGACLTPTVCLCLPGAKMRPRREQYGLFVKTIKKKKVHV